MAYQNRVKRGDLTIVCFYSRAGAVAQPRLALLFAQDESQGTTEPTYSSRLSYNRQCLDGALVLVGRFRPGTSLWLQGGDMKKVGRECREPGVWGDVKGS